MLNWQKGWNAFDINFLNPGVNPLTSNTYFRPQSFPPSDCSKLLETRNWQSVRPCTPIFERAMMRQPSQGDMAGTENGDPV